MKEGLKLFDVFFKGAYPVGNCLVIAAYTLMEAEIIAGKTIQHTDEYIVEELKVEKPSVIVYLSGEY